jgi:hypothetical protein
MRFTALAVALLLAVCGSAEDVVAPGDTISTLNIPAVPAAVADKVDRYGNYRSARFAHWHPDRLETLIATRLANTTQVHRMRHGFRKKPNADYAFYAVILFAEEYLLGLNR